MTPLSPTVHWVTMDTTNDSFTVKCFPSQDKPCKTARTAATCTDRDGGSTGPLFRSRIWMFLFRPFAEFALF